MTSYINPTIIELDDINFLKLDIAPETALFKEADFAILNAGSMVNLTITVDRDKEELRKDVLDVVLNGSDDCEPKFKEDADVSGVDGNGIIGIPVGGLRQTNAVIHPKMTNNQRNTSEALKGIIFSMMVSKLFETDSIDFSSIDFSEAAQRSSGLFFQVDSTVSIPNDVKEKTF